MNEEGNFCLGLYYDRLLTLVDSQSNYAYVMCFGNYNLYNIMFLGMYCTSPLNIMVMQWLVGIDLYTTAYLVPFHCG